MNRTILRWLVCVTISAATPVAAQNLVTGFKLDATPSQIRLLIESTGSLNYEVLPFHSRSYTLIRIHPLRFESVKRDSLMRLVSLHEQVNVFELLGKTVMLALKDTKEEDLTVLQSEEGNQLNVVMVRKSLDLPAQSAIEKSSVDGLLKKANSLLEKGNHQEAIEAVREAIKIQPGSGRAFFIGGQIRFASQQWKMARYNFKKAAALREAPAESEKYIARIDNILQTELEREVVQEPDITIQASPAVTLVDKPEAGPSGAEELHREGPFLPEQGALRVSVDTPPVYTSSDSSTVAKGNPEAYEGRSYTKGYFQLGLFFIIFGGSIGWVYLIKRRFWPLKSRREPTGRGFDQIFEGIRGNSQAMKESDIHATKDGGRRKAAGKMEAATEKVGPVYPGSKKASRMRSHRDDTNQRILFYAEKGYEVEEIARMLGTGIGAVQLAVSLAERRKPDGMSVSEPSNSSLSRSRAAGRITSPPRVRKSLIEIEM